MATKFIGRPPFVSVERYSKEQPTSGPRSYRITLNFNVQVDDEIGFAETFQAFHDIIEIAIKRVEGRQQGVDQ